MTYTVKITDDWIPLPDAILGGRQWRDGDTLELELVGDVLLVRNLTVRPPSEPLKRPK